MLSVGGGKGEAVFDRGGGDERIGHLQAVAEDVSLDQCSRARRDRLGDRQDARLA